MAHNKNRQHTAADPMPTTSFARQTRPHPGLAYGLRLSLPPVGGVTQRRTLTCAPDLA